MLLHKTLENLSLCDNGRIITKYVVAHGRVAEKAADVKLKCAGVTYRARRSRDSRTGIDSGAGGRAIGGHGGRARCQPITTRPRGIDVPRSETGNSA